MAGRGPAGTIRVITVLETKASMNPPISAPSSMKGRASRNMETQVMLKVVNSGVWRRKTIRQSRAAKNPN